MDENPDELYGERFFDDTEGLSLSSAEVIVPIMLDLVAPESVIDVGCGRGAFLKAFIEHGVSSVAGVDGSYVERDRLLIPFSCFSPVDLSSPFSLPRRYSLAMCLEVAEHLPQPQSPHLVKELTKCADVVLFSAAVPGQGGTYHVNEQWPQFWIDLFGSRGFRPYNSVRSRIRDNRRVSWWYRQNIIVFVSESALSMYPKVTSCPVADAEPLEWVHRQVFDNCASRPDPTIRALWRSIRKTLGNSIRFRLSRARARSVAP